MLGRAAVLLLLAFCVTSGTQVTIAYQYNALVVMIRGAPLNSSLRLVRLSPNATDCDNSWAVPALFPEERIPAPNTRRTFTDEGLHIGNYCAVVSTPKGNYTSPWPAQVKEKSGDVTVTSTQNQTCQEWKAVIDLQGSYTKSSIQVSVKVLGKSVPRCEVLRMGLWLVNGSAGLDRHLFCLTDRIKFASEKTEFLGPSVEVLFQNLSAGNYCVRYGRQLTVNMHRPFSLLCYRLNAVTPVCSPPEQCLTLASKVIELPSVPLGNTSQAPEEFMGRLLSLMWLLPLLVFLTVTITLAVYAINLGRRPSWKVQNKSSTMSPLHLEVTSPMLEPGSPVVKVVYSRDSEPHLTAVWQLCELLKTELGMHVVWDEAAAGPVHVTHGWAMAMAQLSCPIFNPAAVQAVGGKVTEKMLVLESDGALLKHQAYRQHKDLGAVSESNVDELYHTTYAALLSNQAQALGDYCHIVVARLPYTTLPGRLDLVPEKRYLLPQHLRQLLAALVHGTGLPESRADAAYISLACRNFNDALANAGKLHEERGYAADSLCGRLDAMLREL